jgi:hypothetical protein
MSLASLRQSLRGLRIRPALTLAAVVTIGLAVGSATAIYSAVQAVLLSPLPFAHPDRLVVIWETDLKKNAPVIELSHREFDQLRDGATVFEQVAAYTAANLRVNLTGRGEPVQVEAALISPGFFGTLGVAPGRGRDFGKAELTDTTGARVLISDGLWRRHYGGEAAVVGGDINVGGTPATVVGIMPPGMLPRSVDVWISTAGLADGAPDLGVLKLVARLKPGVSPEAAKANLDVVLAAMAEKTPARAGLAARVVPLTRAADRPDLRPDPAGAAPAGGGRRLPAARGVGQRRQPAARARRGPSEGACRPRGDGRQWTPPCRATLR